MKLLKQFHSTCAAHTPLKWGVNEKAASAPCTWLKPGVNESAANQAACESVEFDFINTRFQPGVGERKNGETVLTVSG